MEPAGGRVVADGTVWALVVVVFEPWLERSLEELDGRGGSFVGKDFDVSPSGGVVDARRGPLPNRQVGCCGFSTPKPQGGPCDKRGRDLHLAPTAPRPARHDTRERVACSRRRPGGELRGRHGGERRSLRTDRWLRRGSPTEVTASVSLASRGRKARNSGGMLPELVFDRRYCRESKQIPGREGEYASRAGCPAR